MHQQWIRASWNCAGGEYCQAFAPLTSDKSVLEQECGLAECETFLLVTSEWSACNPSCGSGGVRTRTAVCQSSLGFRVPLEHCTSDIIPLAELCEDSACSEPYWVVSAWGACSAACLGGTQTRTRECFDRNGNAAPDSACDSSNELGVLPLEQACNTAACELPPVWRVAGWSDCSADCGGSRTRLSPSVCVCVPLPFHRLCSIHVSVLRISRHMWKRACGVPTMGPRLVSESTFTGTHSGATI